MEVWQGARTLGVDLDEFLGRLREAGLGSLPGTAAESLDDEVRRVICPDKITTGEWLEVMESAHRVGLGSTATIMFGHVDGYRHWARHLLRVRDLAGRTGGFTEFVPLPFVHMESPMYLRGRGGLAHPPQPALYPVNLGRTARRSGCGSPAGPGGRAGRHSRRTWAAHGAPNVTSAGSRS